MIAGEVKNENAVIRFHDEYFQKEPAALFEISRIVSLAYRRRLAGNGRENARG